jgi:hypothetical protein
MNQIVLDRIDSILRMLDASAAGGVALSGASKGQEREKFISHMFESVIAPPFRFGSGDITDSSGHRTGQLDIVLEFGYSISFPLSARESPRRYLAEGVCAVFEVKSDLSKQWDEVIESHKRLAPIRRNYAGSVTIGGPLQPAIPHFAIGYNGWSKLETLEQRLAESGINGILVIGNRLYASADYKGTGPASLFACLVEIENLTAKMVRAVPNYSAYMTP